MQVLGVSCCCDCCVEEQLRGRDLFDEGFGRGSVQLLREGLAELLLCCGAHASDEVVAQDRTPRRVLEGFVFHVSEVSEVRDGTRMVAVTRPSRVLNTCTDDMVSSRPVR